MEVAERLETIEQQCRTRYRPYPDALVTAICQYAAGKGSLSSVQQEWQKARSSVRYYPDFFIVISDQQTKLLDEMDLRVLDMCRVTDRLSSFFTQIALAGPVEQARDYLLSSGMNTQDAIKIITDCYHFWESDKVPNALGRLILSYIPDQFDEVLKYLASTNNTAARKNVFLLLCSQRPEGYMDLAWQLAQPLSLREADEYAPELLKADPARFAEWARQVAQDSIQYNQLYEYPTLAALLELDLAQYLDLAVAAAQAPLGTYYWSRARLQRIGV